MNLSCSNARAISDGKYNGALHIYELDLVLLVGT